MDYLFVKSNDFIFHYIEIYYNRYFTMFCAFLLYKENKDNNYCDSFYKFLKNENILNILFL